MNDTNIAVNKITHGLASNYYTILSPPPCQAKAQATHNSNATIKRGKGRITWGLPTDHQNSNKIAEQWKRRLKSRHEAQQNCTTLRVEEETTYRWATESLTAINDDNAQRTYLHDDKELQQGVLNGSIPSAVVDSGATSSVGTPTDPFAKTGR
jgi:hypothetical protein